MGEPQHKVGDNFPCLCTKMEKKKLTILSNTFMVTVTQDDSKCKWQQHAHLAKARSLFYSKIRSVIERVILFNTSNFTDWLSYLICFK